MKRRGFLGLLGAAIAAPFVPTPAVPTPPPAALVNVVYQFNATATHAQIARQVAEEIMRAVRRQPYRLRP
jgi:hypothetical protein